MINKVFSAIVFVLLFSQATFAHHLWIEKEGTVFKVLWGHPPETNPYDHEKLKEVKAFNNKGKETLVERKNDKDIVYLSSKSDISMIVVSFEGGYLVTTPDGKKKLTKREAAKEGLQVVDSIYSLQFAKGLFAYSDSIGKPSGLRFEIVPQKNPYKLKPNEIFPVRIYFDGKPLEGATIEASNHAEAGKTDKEGNFRLKLPGKGIQIILAKCRIPTKDNPDADYLSYTTVLTFEVK